jgi:hypothetical protein
MSSCTARISRRRSAALSGARLLSWSIRREASKQVRGGTKEMPRCIASWRR